jgi:hypothetical protein
MVMVGVQGVQVLEEQEVGEVTMEVLELLIQALEEVEVDQIIMQVALVDLVKL